MSKLVAVFVLALTFSPSLGFAVEPPSQMAPEPISSSLFIIGGAVLLMAKLKKKI